MADTKELDALQVASAVIKGVSRSSLTRNAQDTICMFPCVASSDFLIDDSIPFFKEVERYYASLLTSIISAQSDYDMGKYRTPLEYLQKFHSNENVNPLLRSLDSHLQEEGFQMIAVESATLLPDSVAKQIPPDFVMECWLGTDVMFNKSSLNRQYTPHAATQAVMESIVSQLHVTERPAMEGRFDDLMKSAGKDDFMSVNDQARGAPDKINTASKTVKTPVYDYKRDANGQIMRDADGNPLFSDEPVRDKKGNPILQNVPIKGVKTGTSVTGTQKLVPIQRINSMEPTMIEIQLTGHKQGGGAVVIRHNIVIGVKVMIRTCPPDAMIANLVKGVTGSRAIFEYIKWTTGERKFVRDFVFGVSSAKELAIKNKNNREWLINLKRNKLRGMLAKVGLGNDMLPITTVCATANEVARVAEQTGVDLNDPYAVIKMMNKFYMLAFAIVDPAAGTLKILFDGDTQYNQVSLNVIKGGGKKGDDLTNFVTVLRALGGVR